ncbi:zinc-binding dehydrogenase [Pseudarthrobacter sp. CC12]|uniref:zinc-binding dehydrogenase n=1 Tax=Pseudarthrobacter sp. CC12 TaxID=3029193 RepID=UPI0032663EE8
MPLRRHRHRRRRLDAAVPRAPADHGSRKCGRHHRSGRWHGALEGRRPGWPLPRHEGRRCVGLWQVGRRLRAPTPRHRRQPGEAAGRGLLRAGRDGHRRRADRLPRDHGRGRGETGHEGRRDWPGRPGLHRRPGGSTVRCGGLWRRGNPETQKLAGEIGLAGVAESITAFKDKNLDLIVDYAGFGTTTSAALETLAEFGTLVQVGMGRLEATINTYPLIINQLSIKGSKSGTKEDLENLYALMKSGQLNPPMNLIKQADIPGAIDKLRKGGVVGRFIAVYED